MQAEQEKAQEKEPKDEKRTFTIIVNSREKTVETKTLSFWDVIKLAFPDPAPGPQIFFTVVYRKGPDKKPKSALVEGDTVPLKDGMVFDVTRTDRS